MGARTKRESKRGRVCVCTRTEIENEGESMGVCACRDREKEVDSMCVYARRLGTRSVTDVRTNKRETQEFGVRPKP